MGKRLTKRHEYMGKKHISVDSEANGISCSNFCTNCGKADCGDIKKALFKLTEYEDLEEQGKLLIMAYEIRTISECIHCNHIERRIQETWIRPELLQHDGFYRTQKEAEDALRKLAGV